METRAAELMAAAARLPTAAAAVRSLHGVPQEVAPGRAGPPSGPPLMGGGASGFRAVRTGHGSQQQPTAQPAGTSSTATSRALGGAMAATSQPGASAGLQSTPRKPPARAAAGSPSRQLSKLVAPTAASSAGKAGGQRGSAEPKPRKRPDPRAGSGHSPTTASSDSFSAAAKLSEQARPASPAGTPAAAASRRLVRRVVRRTVPAGPEPKPEDSDWVASQLAAAAAWAALTGLYLPQEPGLPRDGSLRPWDDQSVSAGRVVVLVPPGRASVSQGRGPALGPDASAADVLEALATGTGGGPDPDPRWGVGAVRMAAEASFAWAGLAGAGAKTREVLPHGAHPRLDGALGLADPGEQGRTFGDVRDETTEAVHSVPGAVLPLLSLSRPVRAADASVLRAVAMLVDGAGRPRGSASSRAGASRAPEPASLGDGQSSPDALEWDSPPCASRSVGPAGHSGWGAVVPPAWLWSLGPGAGQLWPASLLNRSLLSAAEVAKTGMRVPAPPGIESLKPTSEEGVPAAMMALLYRSLLSAAEAPRPGLPQRDAARAVLIGGARPGLTADEVWSIASRCVPPGRGGGELARGAARWAVAAAIEASSSRARPAGERGGQALALLRERAAILGSRADRAAAEASGGSKAATDFERERATAVATSAGAAAGRPKTPGSSGSREGVAGSGGSGGGDTAALASNPVARLTRFRRRAAELAKAAALAARVVEEAEALGNEAPGARGADPGSLIDAAAEAVALVADASTAGTFD